MYHLMGQNKRDVEKEREKVAAANAALFAVSAAAAAQHQSQFHLQGGGTGVCSSSIPCATSFPLPLSPTSLSPFFSSSHINNANTSKSETTSAHSVTEIFSSDLNEQANRANLIMEDVEEESTSMDESGKQQNLTTIRRHTFGPSGGGANTNIYLPTSSLKHFPHPYAVAAAKQHTYNLQDYQAILPHITNLTQNLNSLVCNLPPESFSAKDPHLLKPPPVLGADFSTLAIGRRASDGGAYTATESDPNDAQPDINKKGTGRNIIDGSNTSSPNIAEQSTLANPCILDGSGTIIPSSSSLSDSPNHQASTLSTFMVPKRGSGIMSGSPINPSDSPRKRRTGLHTVLEKPPDIHPELVQEVEFRIQQNQSPISHQHQHHLNISSIPSTPPYSPLQSQTSPGGICNINLPNEACSSPPITVTPPPCGGGGGIQPPLSMISPLMSPSKPGSLRARRTGLSTVMEIGKSSSIGKSIGKESTSLLLPTERFSPVRRLSDGSPFSRSGQGGGSMNASSMPASRDVSPCYTDVRALQEEVLRLQNETQSFGSSLESTVSSSGYMSPNTMVKTFPCSLCASSQMTKLSSSDVAGK